jgi:hypothetical protein
MERIPLQLEQQSDQAVCSKAPSTPTQRRMFKKTRPHRRLQPQSQPFAALRFEEFNESGDMPVSAMQPSGVAF